MAEENSNNPNITLYALSTCAWCNKIKRFLAEHELEYEGIDVDLLAGEEKQAVRDKVRAVNPRRSYPTMVVGEETLVGYDEDRLKEVLGV